MNNQKNAFRLALDNLNDFINLELFASLLLMMAGILALMMANSSLSQLYNNLIEMKLTVGIGSFILSKPLLLWINEGLMIFFFLLMGLEIKREILIGQLSKISQILLPGVAALGGIVVPTLIFWLFNRQDPITLLGWAIPSATDIAFALGVLTLLGKRVPSSLKVFLMTLAIFDDLAAIIFIALFYTSTLSILSLVLAITAVIVLILLNRFNVTHLPAYLFVGLILWWFVLKSGVHATLAGVVIALCIPFKAKQPPPIYSPLEELEKMLYKWVAYLILPLFAFANSGIAISSVTSHIILQPLTLGITLGLFLGKQLGVFSFSYLLIKLKLATLPPLANFGQLYGTAALCGIGFTMSLFISSLAFEHVGIDYSLMSRVGILLGSGLSMILGLCILKLTTKK